MPNFYGAHGYDPRLVEMSAIFFAAGPDVCKRHFEIVRNIDIAPTILDILGVLPAPTVQGRSLHPAATASTETTTGTTTSPATGTGTTRDGPKKWPQNHTELHGREPNPLTGSSSLEILCGSVAEVVLKLASSNTAK